MNQLPKRTLDYIAHGAPEGHRNEELAEAARQFRDAGYPQAEAEAQLLPRAGEEGDGLGDGEVYATIRSQYSRAAREPAGGPQYGKVSPSGRRFSVTTMAKPQYSVENPDAKLPAPVADGARALLKAAFKPGESIEIVLARTGDDGKELPDASSSHVFTYETWMKKLNEKDGVLPLGNSERNGLYVCINPLSGGKRKDDNVTAFRHALVEFDHMPKEQQWELIKQSGIPCTAIVDSGGRSLHAWVKVDATSREQYSQRVKVLFDHFAEYGIDVQNKNASRLCRFANCARGDKRQELLALNVGAASFLKWEAGNQQSFLPAIHDAASELVEDLPEPVELVAGLLHQGSKMVLGGGSKSFKTWSLTDLAVSVAAGVPWWGFPTKQGRALYVNFEIQRFFFRKRLNDILKAKGVALEPGQLDHWCLRGYAADLGELKSEILRRIEERQYALIILDPIYKCLGDSDENKAGDIGRVLNEIESIAVKTGAAMAFGAHFSKGNQAGKESMDRISGSGVFARDPDTILVMTPHATEGAFTVDVTLRNFAPVAPLVVKRQHPLMVRADALNPENLKLPRANAKKYRKPTPEEFMSLLPATWPQGNPRKGLLNRDQLAAAFKERGFDKAFLSSTRAELVTDGAIVVANGLENNEKLTGRPVAVRAYEQWRAENPEAAPIPKQAELPA